MDLATLDTFPRVAHPGPPQIPGIRNINIPHNRSAGKAPTHYSPYIKFN